MSFFLHPIETIVSIGKGRAADERPQAPCKRATVLSTALGKSQRVRPAACGQGERYAACEDVGPGMAFAARWTDVPYKQGRTGCVYRTPEGILDGRLIAAPTRGLGSHSLYVGAAIRRPRVELLPSQRQRHGCPGAHPSDCPAVLRCDCFAGVSFSQREKKCRKAYKLRNNTRPALDMPTRKLYPAGERSLISVRDGRTPVILRSYATKNLYFRSFAALFDDTQREKILRLRLRMTELGAYAHPFSDDGRPTPP